ncbi:MAG: hypothetical protein ABH836_08210 [Candidatus Omnitrophota bacterium]
MNPLLNFVKLVPLNQKAIGKPRFFNGVKSHNLCLKLPIIKKTRYIFNNQVTRYLSARGVQVSDSPHGKTEKSRGPAGTITLMPFGRTFLVDIKQLEKKFPIALNYAFTIHH